MKYLVKLLKWIARKVSKERKDQTLSIRHLCETVHKYTVPLPEAVRIVQMNLDRLISPLGEFHWRGLNHPDKAHVCNGDFHGNEQGDATLHTGALMTALAWRYFDTQDNSILETLDKLLCYFELHQNNNNGGLGRNFVKGEYYDQFLDSEKDGSKNGKSHMRFKSLIIGGKTYWQRYDISIDAITHAICGLYWLWVYVPPLSTRAKISLMRLENFLTICDWKIKDEKGNLVRYGNHSPEINLFSRMNQIILQSVSSGKSTMTSFDRKLFDNVPSYAKGSDIHYFNTFMDLMQILVLNHLKFNCTKRMQIIKEELEGCDNPLFDSVYNVVTGSKVATVRNLKYWTLNTGHPFGKLKHTDNVPEHLRTGYCRYEFAPFISCIGKRGTELTGNHDLLLAYWIK